MNTELNSHLAKDPQIRRILITSFLKLLVLLALALAGSTLTRYLMNKEDLFSFGAERTGILLAVFALWTLDVVKTFRTTIKSSEEK